MIQILPGNVHIGAAENLLQNKRSKRLWNVRDKRLPLAEFVQMIEQVANMGILSHNIVPLCIIERRDRVG